MEEAKDPSLEKSPDIQEVLKKIENPDARPKEPDKQNGELKKLKDVLSEADSSVQKPEEKQHEPALTPGSLSQEKIIQSPLPLTQTTQEKKIVFNPSVEKLDKIIKEHKKE